MSPGFWNGLGFATGAIVAGELIREGQPLLGVALAVLSLYWLAKEWLS